MVNSLWSIVYEWILIWNYSWSSKCIVLDKKSIPIVAWYVLSNESYMNLDILLNASQNEKYKIRFYLVMSEVLPTWLSPRNTNLNFVRIPIWALYKIKNCYRSWNTPNKKANPSLEPDKKFSNPGRLFRKYKLFREVNFYFKLSRTKSGNPRLGPDRGSRLI